MKIKKLISGITAALVMVGAVPVLSPNPVQDYAVTASAADYTMGTYENLTYKKYSDHIEIYSYRESLAEVVIPAEIEGLPVTSIGGNAFAGYSKLTSIIIPDSVTIIGSGAFEGCSGLTSITIPDSVTSIGSHAFNGCSSLESITIPDSVTSIGTLAFYNCSSLESIIIPDGVTSIGIRTFDNCSSLMSVTIPNSVTIIGDSAFNGCKSLTSITIPNSVISIGNYAFKNCSGLISVTLSDSLTSISDYAFENCSSLESITIPESVASIGDLAFSNCSELKEITILNPECKMPVLANAICNGYDDNYSRYFNGTIRGYENSTAQAYAEKHKYNFEAIKETVTPESAFGDANCDGEISVADATLVLQYCGNKDKYKLSEQGIINADVDGTAGISAMDALVIQQYDAGIYNAGDLPLKK